MQTKEKVDAIVFEVAPKIEKIFNANLTLEEYNRLLETLSAFYYKLLKLS